jgi:hypothetical protein
MCKFLIAAVAALLSAVPLSASAVELETTPAAATTPRVIARTDPGTSWIALAVSRNGRVFQSDPYGSEERARTSARSECEQNSGWTCSDTLSVPDFWNVVVLRCSNRYFLGGSSQGMAYAIALEKAANEGFSAGRCQQISSR